MRKWLGRGLVCLVMMMMVVVGVVGVGLAIVGGLWVVGGLGGGGGVSGGGGVAGDVVGVERSGSGSGSGSVGEGIAVERTLDRDGMGVETVHAAMIFDDNRWEFSRTVMRSMVYQRKGLGVVFHVVAPRSLWGDVGKFVNGELGGLGGEVKVYGYEECERFVGGVWFIGKGIHLSAMCKVFLSEILKGVEKVLYVDSDAMVIQDVGGLCWFGAHVRFGEEQMIGMGVDMGASCQDDPDLCYPVGFDWVIPKGLKCATVPYRAKKLLETKKNVVCQNEGEREPYQFNGGVMLMDLKKMREFKFVEKFVRSAIFTWKMMGFKEAHWGEQDLINNFFRFYPETLYELDCGCNFQYSAARREVKCPGRPIVIAHAWTRQLADTKSHDPNNRYFNYFRFNQVTKESKPPLAPLISLLAPDWNASASPIQHNPLCDLQAHGCKFTDRIDAEKMPLRTNDKVYVLTRTARRPLFFKEMFESVREQTHQNIEHLIVSDDPDSMSYLQGTSAINIPSLYSQFDPKEVCQRCKGPDGESCARAPGLTSPVERQRFFDCFCDTGYPMNSYLDILHHRITQAGWVIYLDDDNLLMNKFSVSELLAHAEGPDELLAFRSTLGRVTPSDYNFGKRVVMGDFDASNFAFYSKHLRHAVWGRKRCGDFRAGASLAKHLPVRWIDTSFIQSNPLRAALGGLGMRGESVQAGVTVVITSYQDEGWRPNWLKQTLTTYLSDDYEPIIAKVLLVWNNMERPVPKVVPQESERFVIVRPTVNSLNNRWTLTLPHVKTDLVLNLDDDLYITKAGIICMMGWQQKEKTRVVGPFVRRVEGSGTYILDELKDSSHYSMVLPRALMAPRVLLEHYSLKEHTSMRQYVDDQIAHCDDVLLNLVALRKFEKPPLRVVLPEHTIVDYYSQCWGQSKNLTGGLGLQKGRTPKRSQCVKHLVGEMKFKSMKASKQLGTCLPRGNVLVKENYALPSTYSDMVVPNIICGED